MKHSWNYIKETNGFPAKIYKCTVCNIGGVSLWSLTGYGNISVFDENISFLQRSITCEEFIIKNIIE